MASPEVTQSIANDTDMITDEIGMDEIVISVIILVVIAMSGVIGNSLVFLGVMFEAKLKAPYSIFIANISVAGFLFSVICIPIQISLLLNDIDGEITETVICKLLGYLNASLFLTTLSSFCAIAVNRYVVVMRSKNDYLELFSVSGKVVWIILLWISPAALSACSIPYFGYNNNIRTCTLLSTNEAYWFICVLIASPTLITVIIIFSLYYSIFKTVRKSKCSVGIGSPQETTTEKVFHISKSADSSDAMGDRPITIAVNDSEITMASRRDGTGQSPKYVCASKESVDSKTKASHITANETVCESSFKRSGSKINASHIEYRESDRVVRVTSRETKTHRSSSTPIRSPKRKKGADVSDIKIDYIDSQIPMEIIYSDGKSQVATGFHVNDSKISHIQANFDTERSIAIRTDDNNRSIEITDTCCCNSPTKEEKEEILASDEASENMQYAIKLTYQLFILFCLYFILYLPMSLAYLVNKWYPFSSIVWIIAQLLSSSYIGIAWIICGFLRPEFSNAYLKVLKCVPCCNRIDFG